MKTKLVEFGDIMTIEEWEDCVACGAFIDYDGYGHFCNPDTNEMEGDIDVYPSLKGKKQYNEEKRNWTHITWFNR